MSRAENHLSVYQSLSLSISLFLSLSIFISLFVSVSIVLFLSLSISLYLSIYLYISIYVSLSFSLSIFIYFYIFYFTFVGVKTKWDHSFFFNNVLKVNSLKRHLQHSMGSDATCSASTRPGGPTGGARGRCVRNTKRTLVFFLPTSVSPFLSSMSEFLSFRIPAQSIL